MDLKLLKDLELVEMNMDLGNEIAQLQKMQQAVGGELAYRVAEKKKKDKDGKEHDSSNNTGGIHSDTHINGNAGGN